jgi:hypothetical protein
LQSSKVVNVQVGGRMGNMPMGKPVSCTLLWGNSTSTHIA